MLALFEQWVLLLKNSKLTLCIEAAWASDTSIVDVPLMSSLTY